MQVWEGIQPPKSQFCRSRRRKSPSTTLVGKVQAGKEGCLEEMKDKGMSVLRVVSLTQESMEAETTRERGPLSALGPLGPREYGFPGSQEVN